VRAAERKGAIGGSVHRLYNPGMTLLVIATLGLVTILQSLSPAQQPSSDVIARAQAVLASIAAGEFTRVEEQFTADMKVAMPSGRLAAMWTTLLDQAGAHKSCGTDGRVRRIADKQMVITPCEFERAKVDVQFAFDSAGRISGLVFRPSVRQGGGSLYASVVCECLLIRRDGNDDWIGRVGPARNADRAGRHRAIRSRRPRARIRPQRPRRDDRCQ